MDACIKKLKLDSVKFGQKGQNGGNKKTKRQNLKSGSHFLSCRSERLETIITFSAVNMIERNSAVAVLNTI